MQRMFTILTRQNQHMLNPEVEIGEFEMDDLDVDTVEVQGSEWIKVGVDTGAGKTAWPECHIREEASW